MEFSGQYLTYSEYQGLGGTLDQMPFNLLEYEARKKIDGRTQNRLIEQTNIPQEVKMCEYAMINSLKGYIKSMQDISQSGNLASETIDGYSVSYITQSQVGEIARSQNVKLDDIILTYLTGVIYNDKHLIYIGVQ